MKKKVPLNIKKDVIQEDLSPALKKIVGAVKVPVNFDDKKELEEYFKNRYL